VIGAQRLAAALGASLLLHGAGLAALEQLPAGWQAKDGLAGRFSGSALRASLRPASVAAEPVALNEKPPTRLKRPSPQGLVAPHAYYPTHLLDERPQIRAHVEPAFPEGAPDFGRVALRLFIGADGRVEELAITESDPPGVFEQAAAQAFAPAQFTPGKIRGEAVKSLMTIEVFFGAPAPLR
jgi:hypothetical protein